LDAADKISILASLAFGGRIKLDEVFCEGIRNITATDIAYADRLGYVIKLLAIAKRESAGDASGNDLDSSSDTSEHLQVRVHPTLLVKSHPLASINDVYNAILIEGDPVGQVMFFGPGAGSGPTASAVVSDVLNIAAILKVERGSSPQLENKPLDPLLACSHRHYCTITPMTQVTTRFYLRLLARDEPGVIGKLGTTFGNNNVSLESVVQIGFQGEFAEIVVITHEVQEGDVHRALEEIRSLGPVDEIPSMLRVL
jgi:homoserine dehydrogenase